MIKKAILLLASFTLFFTALPAQEDEVALVINGKNIYKSELQKEFDNVNVESRESFSSFLDGFITKKLVVEEAHAQRLDTLSQYTYELSSYRNQILRSFIQDTITANEMLVEYSERCKDELNVNHAFIPFSRAPILPADTLEAYIRAVEVRGTAVKDGFENLEVEQLINSFDIIMSFEFQSGHLGWVKSFMLPIELDDVIYSLPLNTVSAPIRTSKGYHIFQVIGKRPIQGNPIIEQVMFNFPIIPASKHIQDSVYNVAIKTMDEISIKGNFQEVCNEYAAVMERDDTGCLFGEVALGSQVPLPIIKASFELEKVGDVSNLVKSSYGFHILRLVQKKPNPSAADIQKMVKSALNDANLFPKLLLKQRERMEREYNAQINEKAYNNLKKLAATINPNDSLFSNSVSNKDEVLLSVNKGDKTFTVEDFLNFLTLSSWYKTQSSKEENPLMINRFEEMISNTLSIDVLRDRIQSFTLSVLSTYEKEYIQNNNPKYINSLTKIADGLLYTTMMDRNVWRKSKLDVDGLQKTFENNKDKYKLAGQSFKGIIVHSKDAETLLEIEKLYTNTLPNATKLKNKYNANKITLSLEQGTWVEGDNIYADTKIYKTKNQRPLKNFPFYAVIGKYITQPQDFSDVKYQVEEDYQNELTKILVLSLKEKYEVKINDSVIKNIK